MTRVLHVTECYSAGVGRAIDNAVRLTDDHHEHHFLWGGEHAPPPGEFVTMEQLPGGFFPRIEAVRHAIARVHPHVVHAHSSWAGVYTRLARVQVPVVYQPHCYKFDDHAAPIPLRWTYWLGEAALARRADAVVVLSSYEDNLARHLSSAVPRLLIPNVATVKPEPQIHPSWSGPERVVMSGRIFPQKDPEFFTEVALMVQSLRPGTRFTWIGDGDQRARERLEAAGIEVTGWLDSDALAARLASPLVYFHSARYEGFPLSVLDAAAFDHPVVVREIAAFAGSGLLQVSGVSAAARTLAEVLNHGPARAAAEQSVAVLNATMSELRQKDALENLYDHYGELSHVGTG